MNRLTDVHGDSTSSLERVLCLVIPWLSFSMTFFSSSPLFLALSTCYCFFFLAADFVAAHPMAILPLSHTND
jgi:hypothetical protein